VNRRSEGKQEKAMTTMAANTFGLLPLSQNSKQSTTEDINRRACSKYFFGIDIALGNADTDDFTLRAMTR
jgi:hypothetical protein